MSTNEHVHKKKLTDPPKTIKFKIQRREKEGADARWETFEIPYRRNLNGTPYAMTVGKGPLHVFLYK